MVQKILTHKAYEGMAQTIYFVRADIADLLGKIRNLWLLDTSGKGFYICKGHYLICRNGIVQVTLRKENKHNIELTRCRKATLPAKHPFASQAAELSASWQEARRYTQLPNTIWLGKPAKMSGNNGFGAMRLFLTEASTAGIRKALETVGVHFAYSDTQGEAVLTSLDSILTKQGTLWKINKDGEVYEYDDGFTFPKPHPITE